MKGGLIVCFFRVSQTETFSYSLQKVVTEVSVPTSPPSDKGFICSNVITRLKPSHVGKCFSRTREKHFDAKMHIFRPKCHCFDLIT